MSGPARRIPALLPLALLHACSSARPGADAEDRRGGDRMEWWREARFGMFIHWGLSAIPAGAWEGESGHGEWIRDTARIPVERYEEFLGQFNPVRFDADAWAATAAEAGM
ncbi:MAG: alpha-L-fucosidase, partial [Planctomycetota bacterium]